MLNSLTERRSSGDLHNKAQVHIKLHQSSSFEMEMILSCCVGCHLLFHLQLGLQVFCMSSMHRSVPSEPSRSERRLWLMSWTRSPFVSWAEWRCSESCWRNLCVYPLPDQIFSSTQIQEQNTDSSCVFQLVLSNPQQWMMHEKAKGEDFEESSLAWTRVVSVRDSIVSAKGFYTG